MKILVSSHAFPPSIGGIETVGRLLAEEFTELGHEVRVVTQTAAETTEPFPFEIVRCASISRLFKLVCWSDVFWQNNLSVRTIWAALVVRKPVVVTHQGSYAVTPRGLDPLVRVKKVIVNLTTSVAISEAVARSFSVRSIIIGNPYDARVFTAGDSSGERRDLVFVGRLVSEKGLDLLIKAVGLLADRGVSPRLTIVGSGPMLEPARDQAAQLGIADRVDFVGPKNPREVANILRQHRVLVVPSRYDEPFGVVALEGIACGCAVVGSRGGGLPEAIGPCGLMFENGDAAALADALDHVLGDGSLAREFASRAPEHLARFHPRRVAELYLNVFRTAIER